MGQPDTRGQMAVRIRTLVAAIAFLALILALVVQSRRAAVREARLEADLRAERLRAQAYHRQVRLAESRMQFMRARSTLDRIAADSAAGTPRP